MTKKKETFRQKVGRAAGWRCESGKDDRRCGRSNAGGYSMHAHHEVRQDDESGGKLFCRKHHEEEHQAMADAFKIDGATRSDDTEAGAHQSSANRLHGSRDRWDERDP